MSEDEELLPLILEAAGVSISFLYGKAADELKKSKYLCPMLHHSLLTTSSATGRWPRPSASEARWHLTRQLERSLWFDWDCPYTVY